jgi:hypothetical protein
MTPAFLTCAGCGWAVFTRKTQIRGQRHERGTLETGHPFRPMGDPVDDVILRPEPKTLSCERCELRRENPGFTP